MKILPTSAISCHILPWNDVSIPYLYLSKVHTLHCHSIRLHVTQMHWYTWLVHVPVHVTQVPAELRVIKELYVNTRHLVHNKTLDDTGASVSVYGNTVGMAIARGS